MWLLRKTYVILPTYCAFPKKREDLLRKQNNNEAKHIKLV